MSHDVVLGRCSTATQTRRGSFSPTRGYEATLGPVIRITMVNPETVASHRIGI